MIRIYLDANILIAAFEVPAPASTPVWSVLNAIEAGLLEGITSQIILAEVLPKPLANGQLDLVAAYEEMLSDAGPLQVQPVTYEILRVSARLRAERLSVKLPDAIHLSTARLTGCHAILLGDKRLAMPSGPAIVEPSTGCLDRIQALAS